MIAGALQKRHNRRLFWQCDVRHWLQPQQNLAYGQIPNIRSVLPKVRDVTLVEH